VVKKEKGIRPERERERQQSARHIERSKKRKSITQKQTGFSGKTSPSCSCNSNI
jgi:hypothetical protein